MFLGLSAVTPFRISLHRNTESRPGTFENNCPVTPFRCDKPEQRVGTIDRVTSLETGMYYTGIGSRETPPATLKALRLYAAELARRGYILRSGGAPGADTACEKGCDTAHGQKRIYIPWNGFQGRHQLDGIVFAGVGPIALALAKQFHPAWDRCSQGARALHARNGYQVLGPKLNEPSTFVLCWTRGGTGQGGTGQALRIARANNIPIYDLGKDESILAFNNFMSNM